MVYFNAISDFIKQNGIVGTALLILILDRAGLFKFIFKYLKKPGEVVHPHRREGDPGDESHVHKRDITEKLDKFERRLAEVEIGIARTNNHLSILENKVSDHLVKAQEADIKMKSMEKDIEYQGAEIAETKGDVKDIFRIMSEIKNLIIQGKNNG